MAILKIARMGCWSLSQPAEPVEDPNDPEIQRLISDMTDTLLDVGGAGLAAPQVHVPLRVVLFHVPAQRSGGTGSIPLTILINPKITPLGPDLETDWEGCLSLPGMMGKVPRFSAIRYQAQSGTGAPIDTEARGFHARVVQHECDHLDAILYPMRMPTLESFGYVEELRQAAANRPTETKTTEKAS
ncbi:MAG: peptide deformylase [Rhodospirillaceae bacterium]